MSGEKETYLDHVYEVRTADETRELYNEWADSYEDEIKDSGYATPGRCAVALAAAVQDKAAPMLDLGCGTGLSGVALAEAGFTTIDGTDFAADMMKKAAEKEGVYRSLIQGDLNRPLPAEPGQYTNMSAIGVFSPHHAPASMIETVIGVLPTGGCFVFSLNDHGMKDPSYGGKVQELAAAGVVEKVVEEYGPHLPKIDLGSTVYVLRKL